MQLWNTMVVVVYTMEWFVLPWWLNNIPWYGGHPYHNGKIFTINTTPAIVWKPVAEFKSSYYWPDLAQIKSSLDVFGTELCRRTCARVCRSLQECIWRMLPCKVYLEHQQAGASVHGSAPQQPSNKIGGLGSIKS